MRMLVAAVAAGTILAVPSSAAADPLCPLGGGPPAAALAPLMSGADAAAKQALGSQYGGTWADTPRQGWSVAIAPGALDATTGKAATIAALTGEHAAYLSERLTVLPTLYGWDEISAVRDQVAALQPSAPDLIAGVGLSCAFSDAWRAVVSIGPAETPDVVARTQALLAPFGDRVHVQYGTGFARPAILVSPAAVPAVNARQYATVPRTARCVRGKAIGVRAADDAALRSVTLTAGKRSVTAKRGKRAQLVLKSRSTRVTLTVSLRDGRTATETVTYRRCG